MVGIFERVEDVRGVVQRYAAIDFRRGDQRLVPRVLAQHRLEIVQIQNRGGRGASGCGKHRAADTGGKKRAA
ncbi:MAG TPA: hypothetical protein VME66_11160 [Candidatus Acidoferrales bacterium]|nr:hypothetical protein [Candidatus Acidoferrales bacterium]